MKTVIAKGHEAIELAKRDNTVTLAKYEDPTEGAREGLSLDEASTIANEDPSLIYAERLSNAVVLSRSAIAYCADGFQVSTRRLTVIAHAETAQLAASVSIGGELHRADDLEITTDRITGKHAGWYVLL